MPEIKFESDWLKANNNVHQGDNIRFLDAGVQDKDKRWVFKVFTVPSNSLNVSVQKKFSLNKKNFTATSKVYGTNSDAWVGKEMRVKIVLVQNPQGDEVDGIRLVAPGAIEAGLESEIDDIDIDE